MKRSRHLTVTPGTIVRAFSVEEAHQLADDWLSVFGKDSSDMNTNAFLWHVFSGGRYPSSEGAEALREYQEQIGNQFVVLSNDRKQALLTDRLPSSASFYDYYVFPPSFAWTMAFTHEAGWLGPYFARHPNYAELDSKARAAAHAREMGWH